MEITKIISNQPLLKPEPALQSTDLMTACDDARTAEKLRAAARQFETVFLHQILKQMKESVDYASFDDEEESGEQIQSMYWSFMADGLGRQGGMGFWKTLYEELATAEGIDTRRHPAQGSALDERL